MTIELPNTDPSTRGKTDHLWVDWATLLAAAAMQAQQLQSEALIRWRAATMDLGNEVWDEWRCRFAGGASIDA